MQDITDQQSYNDTTLDFKHFVTPWHERVILSITFSMACVFSISINATVILLSLFTELRSKKINLFIANLSFSHFLCTALFVLGQNFYILYRETMPFSGCQWLAFINFTAGMQEFVFPPFLAVNRYVSLYHGHMYEKLYSYRNILIMMISAWAYSGSAGLAFTLTGHMGFDKLNEHCCIIVEADDIKLTIIYWAFVVGPLVFVFEAVMIVCNWKIYKKLRHHMTNSTTLAKSVVAENKEILYLMIIEMIIPVYNILKFAFRNRHALMARLFFTTLYLSTAGFRGMVIIWALRPYRNAFKRCVLRRKANQIGPAGQTSSQNPSKGTAATMAASHK